MDSPSFPLPPTQQQQQQQHKDDPAWQLALEEATAEMRLPDALERERKTGWRFWNSHYVGGVRVVPLSV